MGEAQRQSSAVMDFVLQYLYSESLETLEAPLTRKAPELQLTRSEVSRTTWRGLEQKKVVTIEIGEAEEIKNSVRHSSLH